MPDHFHDIRLRDLYFLERLAALGSITAAARELQIPKATASRWLGQLEDRVGVALVKRTTRSVALTERGTGFVVRATEILATAQAAHLEVNAQAPSGTLRVSVPVPMGRMLAGPVIARFRRRMPTVRLEFRLQNERVDLIKEGFDLAIRGGPLEDSEFMVRKLSDAAMWLYSSPAFRQTPLAEIPLIASPGDEMLLRRAKSPCAQGPPAVVVDDRTAVADALVWGAGVGLLPSFLGRPPCDEGALYRLDDEPVVTLPVQAIYHVSQRTDPRLQLLVDEIEHQLKLML